MLGSDQMIKQLMIWFEVLAEPWQLHRWVWKKQSILQMHCFESDLLKGRLDLEQWKFFWARAETLKCSLIRVERIRVWFCFRNQRKLMIKTWESAFNGGKRSGDLLVKLQRAHGGYLGTQRRWRTWLPAISLGELEARFDPGISEWGNP